MEITVKLSNLRTAPRKVRQVANLVRGKKAIEAQSILLFTVNKSARSIGNLLNSAIASAKHDFHLDENNLFVSKIMVDEGPKLKRWHPMSRGRAYPIIKRTSHIVLSLAELNPTIKTEEKSEAKKVEKVKTVKTKKQAIKTEVKKEVKAKRKTVAKK
jgi:large subunit ribosomal protein L22